MRFAILYSKLDPAGINIIERLKEISFTPQFPIIELKKESIFSDDITEKKYPELKNIDFLIFATKHRSEKGNPSLSLHAPGNWRNADLGGKPGKVCKTSAFVMKYLFQELNKNYETDKASLNQDYQITLEVTHHGPQINFPCCFIELGSSEKQWQDKEAAKILAKTILTLENYPNTHIDNWQAVIGIGGPHYAPNFNKIELNSEYALGHIIPEYNLVYGYQPMETMIKEALLKTVENVDLILLDWKGCGKSEERKVVTDTIEKMGFKWKRTEKVEK